MKSCFSEKELGISKLPDGSISHRDEQKLGRLLNYLLTPKAPDIAKANNNMTLKVIEHRRNRTLIDPTNSRQAPKYLS